MNNWHSFITFPFNSSISLSLSYSFFFPFANSQWGMKRKERLREGRERIEDKEEKNKLKDLGEEIIESREEAMMIPFICPV